jgi:hypothetical protein
MNVAHNLAHRHRLVKTLCPGCLAVSNYAAAITQYRCQFSGRGMVALRAANPWLNPFH